VVIERDKRFGTLDEIAAHVEQRVAAKGLTVAEAMRDL
jgi:hypothetical protein